MRAVLDKAKVFAHCGLYVPHAGQQMVHDAGPHDYPGGARYRIVAAGVRFGKSHCAAYELIAAALAPNPEPTEWWIVAPLHNLANIVFRNVVAILTQHFGPNLVKASETDGTITGRNVLGVEFRILRRTTERGEVALTGSAVSGMILDEASAIPDTIWESSLSTRLISTNGWVLAISTPRGVGGWWDRMLRAGLRGDDPEVWAMRAPTSMNPRIDPREIEKAKERLPDIAFRENYLAESVARSGRVFDPELVEASATGEFEDPIPGVEYHAGLDLAATTDKTVLTIARKDDGKMRVVFVDSIAPGLEWAIQCERVARHVRRYNDAPIRADATGSGQPVVEMLRAANLTVQAFVFTSASKASLIRHTQLLLERGIVLPKRHLASTAEEACLYQWLDDRGDRAGAPVGSHDDAICSLMLAAKWFHSSGTGGGRVFNGHTGRSWSSPELDKPEVHPKVAEQPAPASEVADEDRVVADLKRRAVAAAARKVKEQAELVRRITGKPRGPSGSDFEPNAPFTQGPRRSPFGPGFDINIDLSGQ